MSMIKRIGDNKEVMCIFVRQDDRIVEVTYCDEEKIKWQNLDLFLKHHSVQGDFPLEETAL